jgi:hypothetical protein
MIQSIEITNFNNPFNQNTEIVAKLNNFNDVESITLSVDTDGIYGTTICGEESNYEIRNSTEEEIISVLDYFSIAINRTNIQLEKNKCKH